VIPEWKPVEEPRIPKAVWYVVPVIVLGAGLGGYLYWQKNQVEPPPLAAQPVPPPAPAVDAGPPAIAHPIPGDPDAAQPAMPALDDSDAPLHDSLAKLVDAKTLDQLLVPDNLVRNIVVTVDNLPRSKAAVDRRPVKATPGSAAVVTSGEDITLSEQNYARYAPFVSLVQSTDAKQLATLYFHYYPLFQQAYENLGYPDKYFNDRLVEVIDHLLATPTPTGPVKLTQPRVFYEYADPVLEQLSAGQKLLIRMGNGNATQLKKKMREFRALIAQGPQPAENQPAG
jgi:Protein of unknown function (DUF3014)